MVNLINPKWYEVTGGRGKGLVPGEAMSLEVDRLRWGLYVAFSPFIIASIRFLDASALAVKGLKR